MSTICGIIPNNTRRIFWTTQPDACGASSACDATCGQPGLLLTYMEQGATFVTTDYVRSIAINILMTDARKLDTLCGFVPGTRGGFWADSFRKDNLYTGSNIRDLKTSYTAKQSITLIKAFAKKDMQKLVSYGIAASVEVAASNLGGGRVALTIDIFGFSGDKITIGATATQGKNSWAWDT